MLSVQVVLGTVSKLITEEGTTTIKEESIVTLELSGQVELGTASTLTTKESIATTMFLI